VSASRAAPSGLAAGGSVASRVAAAAVAFGAALGTTLGLAGDAAARQPVVHDGGPGAASTVGAGEPSASGPAGEGDGGDDVESLARSLARQAEALGTDDCAAACKALASMRRAADRICAMDPGDRCAEARETLEGATRKVRARCPACAVDTQPRPRPAPQLESVGSRDDEARAGVTAAAPPAEHERGGCAGCTASSASAPGGAARGVMSILVGLWFGVRVGRRRRRDRGYEGAGNGDGDGEGEVGSAGGEGDAGEGNEQR
jgi:hypothetical protein